MPTRKRRVRQAEIVRVFAERLKTLRHSRGMTQAELARRSHVSIAYIWKLESGAVAPGVDLVDRLAQALGTSAAEFLAPPVAPNTLAVLVDQARHLFDAILASADVDDLLMLNPLLARLNRAR